MHARASWLIVAGLAACGGGPRPAAAPAPAAPSPPTAAPPTAAPTAGANPCFDGAPPLVAGELHGRLEKHTWSWSQDGDEVPPPERLGTCTAHRGKLVTADGTVVAELGCGVQIFTRGIRDDLGLEIGARGADVIERWPRPHGALVCLPNGSDQVRCRFDRNDGDDVDASSYVVAGELPPEADDTLTGGAAEQFFAHREVVQINYSVWCH